MAFSEQLKVLMLERGMKAVDLARATGLSEAAISDYLKGKKEPRGRQSIAIAKALEVSLDVLWETKFAASAEMNSLTASVKGSSFSPVHREICCRLTKMREEQKKAVLAFMLSLEEVEKRTSKKQP